MNDAGRDVDMPAAATSSTATGSTPPTVATTPGGWLEEKTRGRRLAKMWFMTALLGALFISLTTGASRLLIPVVLMLVYAWRGYRHVESAGEFVALRSARVGQLADSLYFLGFLWTLYALIDSFVIREMSIAEAVFRAFGYALVTTATGMFLRLFLLQFGYSEEEQVRLGERTVEEEIARFSKEVRSAVDSISDFRKQTDAALTGWIKSLNKSTEALKAAVDDVRAQTTDLKDVLAEMHKASAEHIDKLVEAALSQFIQKVAPSFEALNNANSQFVTEVNTSTAKVESAVGAGVKIFEAAVHAGATQIQSELSKGAGAISTSLENSTQTIQTATAKFTESLLTQMGKLESSLADVLKQIGEIRVPADIVEKAVAEQLDRVNARLEESTRAFQEAITHLSKRVGEIRVPADIVEKAVAEQLDRVNARLEESTRAFQEAITHLSKRVGEIRVPADIVEKAVAEQLDRVNARLEESTRAFQEAITHLSKRVGEVRVPADIVEKTVGEQVAMVTASLVESTKALQEAINKLERLVLTMAEQVRTKRSKPWWKFWA
ncbi:MAG: hypothetical protein QXS96_05020 [Candidatus Caldarchaeum sp.]